MTKLFASPYWHRRLTSLIRDEVSVVSDLMAEFSIYVDYKLNWITFNATEALRIIYDDDGSVNLWGVDFASGNPFVRIRALLKIQKDVKQMIDTLKGERREA